ncbi:MAG: Gfo/Idh/MocA family oxidoreductase [Pseudomonadota bacterium]|nr:Gfo/Idh/MocA family oxidoreductase [Pseudomonadota bacterium]
MLRWGVLGTAGIARSEVVPAIQASSNGRVTAIAGRDRRRSAEFANAFGIKDVFASYEALLDSPDVDAVYIPLPNSLHAEWAVKAADAGKAVLCEKPLALNEAEAKRVADHFAAKNLPLMEGFMYRFHPQNMHALKLARDGAIGEVREVHAHLSVDIMADAAGNVRFDKALGGGSLLDMGCYAVSAARHFLGEPVAALARFDVDPASGVDLACSAILEFSGGRSALISSSFKAGGQGFYQIIGTQGTIDVPRAFIPGMGSRVGEGLVIVADPDGRRLEKVFQPANHYRLMAQAFAEAMLSGRPVPYPPADAVGNMRALDAIAASARSGRRVEIV